MRPSVRVGLVALVTTLVWALLGSQPGLAEPTAPLLPATSITSTTARPTVVGLSWEPIPDAFAYRVVLGTEKGSTEGRQITVYETMVVAVGLEPKTKYWLTVTGLDDFGNEISEPSKPTLVQTPEDTGLVFEPEPDSLRVASYNVHCSCLSDGPSWNTRRTAVANTILGQLPDVIGVQEAGQSNVKGRGVPQYQDLKNLLGSTYALVNANRSASMGTRILYNRKTVTLLERGTRQLSSLPGPSKRYVTWGVFLQNSTRKVFFFANTHLENREDKKGSRKYYNNRKVQAAQLSRIVKAENGDLPTIVVGDFNSHKWRKISNAPYDVMRAQGFIDPLGNGYKSHNNTSGATVENRIRTNYSTYNGYQRTAPHFGYVNGTTLDQIFVTKMRVSEWETVVKVDSRGRFIGTIPSDHNMVRANVWLPDLKD